MVALELPRFVRMLRIFKAINPRGIHEYNFRFEVIAQGPTNLTIQQKILEPFRCLSGFKHLTIGGGVDPLYASDLKDTMGMAVYWARGIAWEIYGLAVSIKRCGDEAFRLGQWVTVRSQYRACKRLLCYAYSLHPIVANMKDDDWKRAIKQFFDIIITNVILIRLRNREWDRVLKKTADLIIGNSIGAPDLNKSRRHLYRAIALAATEKEHEAWAQISMAAKTNPYDELVQSCSRIMSARLQAISNGRKAAIGTIYSDELLSRINEPLQLAPPILNPSENIAGERYLLRQFGYKGDYLPAIKEKSPVDLTKIAKLMQTMEAQKAKLSPGAPYSIEIGGYPNPLYIYSGPGM